MHGMVGGSHGRIEYVHVGATIGAGPTTTKN